MLDKIKNIPYPVPKGLKIIVFPKSLCSSLAQATLLKYYYLGGKPVGMKKHIEKKCLFQFDTPEEIEEGNSIEVATHLKAKDVPKDSTGFIFTEDNKVLIGFPFNDSGRMVFIPEPDPILIYFDSAYGHYVHIKEKRQSLLNHFKGVKMNEDYLVDLYGYYGSVNSFIILLFTSIEAFINYNIPNGYTYTVKSDKRTEIYDKSQIMYLPFRDKIGAVLKEIFQKDFAQSFPLKYQHITNLKNMRNDIVHLKPEKGTGTPFAYAFKKGLNFKFEDSIDAVMDFMNFYKPGFINYCPCSKAF